MNKTEFKAYFTTNKLSEVDYEYTIEILENLENMFFLPAEKINLDQLDAYLQMLEKHKQATRKAFIALMRYFKMVKRHDLFIRLTQYTGKLNVIESIIERANHLHGKEFISTILSDLNMPSLGTPPEKVVIFTNELMNRLKHHLRETEIKAVLTGNNHQIPEGAFAQELVEYENASTFEEYLQGLHARQVAILQQHADESKIWFEQFINQEVVDYVSKDPLLLSGVIKDNHLHLKKIPYDIDGFLKETDPLKRRYLSCHCPFAREAILHQNPDISPLWCYCSAGFEKLPFETVLKQKLKIEVIKSVLAGDDECRFIIDLSHIDYKK
jgi:CheY-like chemotaxis protein